MKTTSLIIISLLIFQSVSANEIIGSLSVGTGMNGKHEPVNNYEVFLYDPTNARWSSPSITDENGDFSFSGLKSDSYILRIYRPSRLSKQLMWQQKVKPRKSYPILLPYIRSIDILNLKPIKKDGKTHIKTEISINDVKSNIVKRVSAFYQSDKDIKTVLGNDKESGTYQTTLKINHCPSLVYIYVEYEKGYSWSEIELCNAIKLIERGAIRVW